MTTFEQVQRQLWDSLMDHERRVFFQLIQGELPALTLRELGEILTSPAARSVADLPVNALLAAATPVAPPAAPRRQRTPTAPASRRIHAHSADAGVANERPANRDGTPAARAPRDTSTIRTRAARSEDSGSASATPLLRPATAPVAAPVAAPLESALQGSPVPERNNVAVIQSAMSRTLAQHSRQDPDTQVVTALRTVGEWIRARDLRPRVGLQPDDLRAVLNRLVKAGIVRREGEGPETVYRLVASTSADGARDS